MNRSFCKQIIYWRKKRESKNEIEQTILFTRISNILNAEINVTFLKRLRK